MREQKKTDPYPPCPPPCCNYSRISGPPEQYNLSPLLPHIGRRYLPYSSPTQYMCLIQLANDLQDPYLTPCTLAIKMDQGQDHFQCWLSLIIRKPDRCASSDCTPHSNKPYSPFILPHTGNSFPTRAQTSTISSFDLFCLSHMKHFLLLITSFILPTQQKELLSFYYVRHCTKM